MVACPDDNLMAQYVGGGLGAAAAQTLAIHLDACSSCRQLAVNAVGDPEASAAARGRYVIERPHARGGQADIFIARDRFLDRAVALKVLRDEGHSAARARFEREARVTGR